MPDSSTNVPHLPSPASNGPPYVRTFWPVLLSLSLSLSLFLCYTFSFPSPFFYVFTSCLVIYLSSFSPSLLPPSTTYLTLHFSPFLFLSLDTLSFSLTRLFFFACISFSLSLFHRDSPNLSLSLSLSPPISLLISLSPYPAISISLYLSRYLSYLSPYLSPYLSLLLFCLSHYLCLTIFIFLSLSLCLLICLSLLDMYCQV